MVYSLNPEKILEQIYPESIMEDIHVEDIKEILSQFTIEKCKVVLMSKDLFGLKQGEIELPKLIRRNPLPEQDVSIKSLDKEWKKEDIESLN